MEGPIEDEDGDFLASLSPAPPYGRLHYSQSEKFGDSAYLLETAEEEDDKVKRFSLDEDQNGARIPIKIFDRFYDSSSDESEFYSTGSGGGGLDNGVVQSAGRRLDNMLQFLDRKLSSPDNNNSDDPNSTDNRSLPEFVASGGGIGMFKVPLRTALHPGRPPSLELRPHPLRETQIGCFLRNLVSTDTQLWAGSERGLRFWNLSELYAPTGMGRPLPSGDEEAASFYESENTSPTLCLIADAGNRLVWSGHRDGRIRSWKMDQSLDGTPFSEALSWQAHRGPVLSMVMSSYGKILDIYEPRIFFYLEFNGFLIFALPLFGFVKK
ncbi:hypothetical protein U1Q18_043041 [Sarracenia purpurea var. burkii]